jgi:hypothetical protein
MEYPVGVSSGSFRLDARELHHLAPFLRLIGDEPTVVSRRAGRDRAARSISRALSLGSLSPALISAFSLATTAAGVFLGAVTPHQLEDQPRDRGHEPG